MPIRGLRTSTQSAASAEMIVQEVCDTLHLVRIEKDRDRPGVENGVVDV